ncbi:MAG: DUF1579 domain-containing protein [Gammaproteobacteria bacterium]|nr:DUF1579 domain-containing protein [Gammaproteobacteria bacterium]
MHKKIIWCLLVPLISVPLVLNAKENTAPAHTDHQAMMAEYARLATPGAPHKQFAKLAGEWTTKTKAWMQPGQPAEETTGTAVFKSLLGGRFLQQEFSGVMMGQPFTGIAIDGFDNLRQKYVSVWIDTMGTSVFIMEGTASEDGKTITMSGEHDEPGGGKMTHRSVWTIVDDNTQTFDMYGAHQGQEEMKMMEIVYKRK